MVAGFGSKMYKLIPRQMQVDYLGLFSKPAIQIYGTGNRLLEELLSAFASFNIGVEDIRNEAGSPNLLEQAVSVGFATGGLFRLKLDRVQVSILDTSALETTTPVFEMLAHIGSWLRSAVPHFAFKMHQFTFMLHAAISGSTSLEVLTNLPSPQLQGVGKSEGTGFIFHWSIPDANLKVQLILDHSLKVDHGLFVQLLVRAESDEIDYEDSVAARDKILEEALSSLNLEI